MAAKNNTRPERAPGRPAVGPKVQVHLPAELLAKVDEIAGREGVTRSDVIRRLLVESLGS